MLKYVPVEIRGKYSIMEILFFWISSIFVSFGMDVANYFRFLKDSADIGYKVIPKKKQDGKQNNAKLALLVMLIPGVNLVTQLLARKKYNDAGAILFEQYKLEGKIEEMTKLEKEIYQQNPTGLNALLTPVKAEVRLAKTPSIKISIDNEDNTGEIFFELNEKKELTIVHATGAAAQLTEKEQKEKVMTTVVKSKLAEILIKSKLAEAMKDLALKNNSFVPKVKQDHDNSSQTSTTDSAVNDLDKDDLKEELEKLREELIRMKNPSQESENKGKARVKRNDITRK